MNNLRWSGVLVMIASCSFPPFVELAPDGAGPGSDAPSGDGSADPPPDTTCQLTSIRPSLANTGDTMTLEGTFGAEVMVNFPGGTVVAAKTVGPHRASVEVPASATAGDLTVTTCGMTAAGAHPFRRASFSLGVGTFVSDYDQAETAHQYPTLAIQRDSHAAIAIGIHLYILGGVTRAGSINSIEHALINADGTLGKFTLITNTLALPRRAHTAVTIRDELYVLGGFNDGALSSIEHAHISSDGQIGPFTTLSTIRLNSPRQGHSAAIIGTHLYVIGGMDATSLGSIERAPIRSDGTLGAFQTLPDVKLETARRGHTSTVVGEYLYVVGGTGEAGVLGSVERSHIQGDGSLSAFETMPGVILENARSGHSAQMIADSLHVFGGAGSNGALRTVERLRFEANVANPVGAFQIVATAALIRPRRNHTTTIIQNYLYMLGGTDDNNRIDRIEHVDLNASGTLDSFSIVPDISLTSERAHGPAVVLGNYLYMIGGGRGSTTVERATVRPDGSLGVFTPVDGVTLGVARDGHTAAIIGNYVYIVGNSTTIERSPIASDGSLGPFETVTATLTTARVFPSTAIVGDYLYVFGGADTQPDLRVEHALIKADGSINPFSGSFGSNATSRTQTKVQLIGGYVYLIGGHDIPSGSASKTPERAQLDGAGGLRPFELASGVVMSTDSPSIIRVGEYLYSLGISGKLERAKINAHADAARPLDTFAPITNITVTEHAAAATAVTGNYLHVIGGTQGRVYRTTTARAQLR